MSDNWENLLDDDNDIEVKKEGETFPVEEIVKTEPALPKPVKKEAKDEAKPVKDKKKKPVPVVTSGPAKPLTDKEKEELER